MKKSFLIIFLLFSVLANAQQDDLIILSGKITDSENGDALIGAAILVKTGVGTVADLDGNYTIKLPKGEYNLVVSMLGYTSFKQKIKLFTNKKLDIKLENSVLNEVEIVANVAQVRETPVAFSSITSAKIQEELGGRDISMIANTTPGAYASAGGGGAGDSRVTIRGFSQNFVAVMVDGVPVNDMENGAVYWSNWAGLKDITKSMQIQRGLGATKLAVASVGGTMNFITNGIESKQQTVVKKEWGNNGYNLIGMSYNSGLINNKWGITLAGTYNESNGWAEQTWNKAYSYFAKIQYMPNSRHIISFGINGAPQSHGQRTSMMPIAVYSKDYAKKLGVNSDSVIRSIQSSNTKYTTLTQGDRSLRWNPDQALLNGSTINDRVNVYNKPLLSLNHFWKISEKTTLSTVVYASFGSGGGTGYTPTITNRDSVTGYYLLQSKYNSNIANVDINYSPTEHKSTTILRQSNNNHKWVGVLSTATTKLNKVFTLTYGIDARYYHGYHTTTVYNLLGGDYYVEGGTNKNPNLNNLDYSNFIKRKDDIFGSNYNSIVKYGGAISQVEFKKGKWVAFFTATGSYTGFQRIDYYKPKDLVLADTTYHNYVSYNTTVVHNGETYNRNSPGIRTATTDWKYQIGYTIKGGANYNINDHHNAFVNIGIMQIPQNFFSTFSFANVAIEGYKPQFIQSFEVGYGFKYNKFNGTVNGYFTNWLNQPQPSKPDPNNSGSTFQTNGINVNYKGIEFEGKYKPIKQLEFDGVLSFGDWKYTSGGTVYSYDQNNVLQGSLEYSAKGVHVGNAAQTQASLGVRIMPFKGLYIKPRITRFDKYYATFNAVDLTDANKNRDSWKLPSYNLLDLSLGYEIPVKGIIKVNLYGTVNNVLNTMYISDAQGSGGFNAASAFVYFGIGRTFVFGTKLTF
jgi:outer membrane receptor protein involved in Fe transport